MRSPIDSVKVDNISTALDFAARVGYPLLIQPSFTLNGEGSGTAHTQEELIELVNRGLDLSPVHEAACSNLRTRTGPEETTSD
jgi:carbamoyl-phosphate synthase large subunit